MKQWFPVSFLVFCLNRVHLHATRCQRECGLPKPKAQVPWPLLRIYVVWFIATFLKLGDLMKSTQWCSWFWSNIKSQGSRSTDLALSWELIHLYPGHASHSPHASPPLFQEFQFRLHCRNLPTEAMWQACGPLDPFRRMGWHHSHHQSHKP